MENTLQLGNLLKEGTYPEEYTGGKNWTILHGDTLKLVKAFQPGIFDAVITDPPYASGGTKQNERNRTTNQKYSSMKAENALPDFDGDNKDQRSWTHWMAEWLYDARKACKVGAPICLFIDWRQYPSITDALQWAGWIWRGTAVWDKGNSRPQKGRFRQQAEYIVWGLRCSSKDSGKVTRTVCTNGCIGCRICEKKCPHGAVIVADNHAVIDYDKCTSCGTCVSACPRKCLVNITCTHSDKAEQADK